MRVKVCGITRLEDAQLAADLGAFAIGFIFWPQSPRYIAAEEARSIVRALSPLVAPIGVFVDQPQAEVNAIADCVGLEAVQLHGNETPDYSKGINRRVIRAIGLRDPMDMQSLAEWPPDVTMLLDAYDPEKRGGTGRIVDWTVAAAIASVRPTILSGGLRSENVGLAMTAVKPYAIDVSSGVEARPGVKDARRLRAFFAAVAQASAGNGQEERS
jgi:phosphoribosylanthranilate isomerase